MHTIRLQFTATAKRTAWRTAGSVDPWGIPDSLNYRNVITETACTLLLVNHNIHTVQTDASTIQFESERDCMFAFIKLSNSAAYTPRIVD